jgi:hypothetical protein
MAEGGATSPAADPETARLLRELNDAGYWCEHLILTADVVAGGVLDCPIPAKATSDGIALAFLLEEAKCSSLRVREATEKLAGRLGVDL